MPNPETPAAASQPSLGQWKLSGSWTARAAGSAARDLAALDVTLLDHVTVDGARVDALDTAGAWLLQRRLQALRERGVAVQFKNWPADFSRLLALVEPHVGAPPPAPPRQSLLERFGRSASAGLQEVYALLAFTGESARSFLRAVPNTARWRWRPILYNIERAGFDALPIVGLTSFLLGIVVAYQSADQLRQYGAGIFVVDLVGYSVLREFAPLITAIIVAGRSGSAYAAQIGTMMVTEEVDALRTLGIPPIDILVLPKLLALLIALPLLTVFSDIAGVFGGMLMARPQLGVAYGDFIDRFAIAVDLSALWIGVGKALVFAAIIVLIGCFQGFQVSGSAESVGRRTTTSVVQAIFVVIVADALFSIVFSILGL